MSSERPKPMPSTAVVDGARFDYLRQALTVLGAEAGPTRPAGLAGSLRRWCWPEAGWRRRQQVCCWKRHCCCCCCYCCCCCCFHCCRRGTSCPRSSRPKRNGCPDLSKTDLRSCYSLHSLAVADHPEVEAAEAVEAMEPFGGVAEVDPGTWCRKGGHRRRAAADAAELVGGGWTVHSADHCCGCGRRRQGDPRGLDPACRSPGLHGLRRLCRRSGAEDGTGRRCLAYRGSESSGRPRLPGGTRVRLPVARGLRSGKMAPKHKNHEYMIEVINLTFILTYNNCVGFPW